MYISFLALHLCYTYNDAQSYGILLLFYKGKIRTSSLEILFEHMCLS